MSTEILGNLLVKIGDQIATNFRKIHEELNRIEILLKTLVENGFRIDKSEPPKKFVS